MWVENKPLCNPGIEIPVALRGIPGVGPMGLRPSQPKPHAEHFRVEPPGP
jgi:hypothetical protein